MYKFVSKKNLIFVHLIFLTNKTTLNQSGNKTKTHELNKSVCGNDFVQITVFLIILLVGRIN